MKQFFTILLVFWFYTQSNGVYAQANINNKVKVESFYNMDKSLGVMFCGNFNNLIYKAALEGKIPVFKTNDFSSTNKLDKKEILKQGAREEFVQMIDPDAPDSETLLDTTILNPFIIDQWVKGYYFTINWQLDPNGYSYTGIPDAFSLAYSSTLAKDSAKMLPLFWIRFNDLKTILVPTEFQQFQKSLFLHVFTDLEKFHYQNYHKLEPSIRTDDIKFYASKNYFLNNRLYTDLDPKQLMKMNQKIYADASSGRVQVFRNGIMDTGEVLEKEELKSKAHTHHSKKVVKMLDALIIDDVEEIPFCIDSIKGNSVSELWRMDYLNNKIIAKIVGLSIDYNLVIESVTLGRENLFCVPYSYIETIVGKSEQLKISNLLFTSLIKNYLEQSPNRN